MLRHALNAPSYLPSIILAVVVFVILVIRIARMISEEGVIQHIKDDWKYRRPNRMRNSPYRGGSILSYAILCCLYYSIKDLIVLIIAFYVYCIKFIVWDLWKWLFTVYKKYWIIDTLGIQYEEDYDYDDDEDYDYDDDEDYQEDIPESVDDVEELPFCQLFTIGPDMCLLIDHVEMSPDEVALIRVVDDEGYTPLYKRKVRRDKAGNRFIVFNNTNYYLCDEKTRPIIKK